MQSKLRIIIVIVLICGLSFIDYQFFNETPTAYATPELYRRAYHLFCFISIAALGYYGLYRSEIAWQKKLYIFFYILALVVILGVTLLDKELHIVDQPVKNAVAHIREDFNTPIPFFIIFALGIYIRRSKKATESLSK
jgi:hypothetical protein